VSPAAFLARETAISVVINAALSAGFCWLIFGGKSVVPIWGVQGLVVDYLPQGFMIGLMGVLVPGLLARRAQVAGRFGGSLIVPGPISAVVKRALIVAAAGAALATAMAAVGFALWGRQYLPVTGAMLLKIAGGALLALIVTPPAIRAAII